MEDKKKNKPKKPVKTRKEIKSEFLKRNHQVNIYFKKETELKTLEENAKNYGSIGKYIKDCALEGRIRIINMPSKIDEKYIKELHKIGVNLNQIALRLNAGLRDLTEQNDLKSIITELQKKIDNIQNSIKS